jgi:hypothetical protein
MAAADGPTPEERARRHAKYLTDLMWHVGAFVIVNTSFWALDIATGGGLTWATWITAAWAFALAFHLLAYWIDGRDLERWAADRYLHRIDESRHHPVG